MKIDSFIGDYFFLSNFYEPVEIVFEGLEFTSVEAAYQAAKTLELGKRKEFVNLTSKEAKKLGKKIKLRLDWDQVKISIMMELVYYKFKNNEDLKEKILDTGSSELIEGNWWGDCYWGVYNGIGKNMLGKILMVVRSRLRKI